MGMPHFVTDFNPSIKGYHQLFKVWMKFLPSAEHSNQRKDTNKLVLRVIDEVESGNERSQRLSIFHTLLDPPTTDDYKKPKDYQKPSAMQLTDDGVSILVAAAFTTGNAMTLSAYHVLHDKAIYSQLRAEILANFPEGSEKLDYLTLEKLPYLVSALIQDMP